MGVTIQIILQTNIILITAEVLRFLMHQFSFSIWLNAAINITFVRLTHQCYSR
jgi:hypothetical protein